MISHATIHVSRASAFRFRPRLPRLRTSVIVLFGALLAASLVGWARLQLPEPTGSYGVGRYRAVWTDVNRSETHLPSGAANRSVPVEVWYPAEEGTGTSSAYIDDLGLIREQLIDKGELSPAVVWGLSLVRTASRAEAKPILSDGLPLLILSPGNQTNVVFYSALAEDLASQGYVVVGIDHPYQVAAVSLPDGSVAGYDSASDGFSEEELSPKLKRGSRTSTSFWARSSLPQATHSSRPSTPTR